jgi:hypothetical protein
MKTKTLFLTIYGFFILHFGWAQKAGNADIKFAVNYLKKSTRKVINFGAKCSEKQLNFAPNELTWSLAGNLEHLIKTDKLYSTIITSALERESTGYEQSEATDTEVISKMSVRSATSQRMSTAPSLIPKSDYKDFAEVKMALSNSRKEIIQYLKTTNDELRGHFAKHPLFGQLDVFQWYLMNAAHTERHYMQMLELSQLKSFPNK